MLWSHPCYGAFEVTVCGHSPDGILADKCESKVCQANVVFVIDEDIEL